MSQNGEFRNAVYTPYDEVSIGATAHGKVVCCGEDVNAVGESPLATHVLLECSLGGGRGRVQRSNAVGEITGEY